MLPWPESEMSVLLSTYFEIESDLELPFNQPPKLSKINSLYNAQSLAVSQGVFEIQ